jgi:hypothetical protein
MILPGQIPDHFHIASLIHPQGPVRALRAMEIMVPAKAEAWVRALL